MSQGKYSPFCKINGHEKREFIFNCLGQIPPEYGEYDQKLHFGNYDQDGYDWYGYSAFDEDGIYVGISHSGVDREGYSELDYLRMDSEEFEAILNFGLPPQ